MGRRLDRGFVYFIAAETVGAVKIGFSRNHPSARLKELQIGSPVPLRIITFVEGCLDDELRLHRTFADLKIHSEWFRFEAPLSEHIASLGPPEEVEFIAPELCPRCGEGAHPGRNHLISIRGVMKICSGPKAEIDGVSK